MFSLNSQNSYQYYTKPCDMRRGFDALCGLVRNELGRNPFNGDVFVFINKSRNALKLLHWERDGLVIYHKRLETGTFSIPKIESGDSSISWPDLVLMLEGIVVQKFVKKPRFSLQKC